MEFGNIAEWITACVAVIAFCLSYVEYRRANKIKRSSYLEPLIEKMKNDADISELVYEFQYHKFKYNSEFHGDYSKDGKEWKLDKTLQYFSYLCYLLNKKIISSDEFLFFEIVITQALRNKNLVDYLYNLFHFECKMEGYSHNKDSFEKCVYGPFLKYAYRKKLIENTFFDKEAYKRELYPRYLNF